MERKNSSVGANGENMASAFLELNGYEVLERNYRRGYGEIDIVSGHAGALVFVEVKTIVSVSDGGISPEDNMTKAKVNKLKRICAAYANSHPGLCRKGWQIDLVAITTPSIEDLTNCTKNVIIKHYENIT